MRKKLVIILGCFVAVLVVLYLILAFSVGSIVKTAVNRFGPGLTNTTVNLDAAQLSPLSGASGSFDNLIIGNPKGWCSANAIVVKKISVSAVPSLALATAITIKELM